MCLLVACFLGDSLCTPVFVGVSMWLECLWLGGLREAVVLLLFLYSIWSMSF